MAKQFDNTNTASFWANAGALDNEKQPVFRGTLDVDGVPKKVSLWLNSFYSEDDDDNAELRELFEELLEIAAEIESRSPILKGKVEDVEGGGGGAKAAGGRRSKREPRGSRRGGGETAASPESKTEGNW
jgi:hypothetical protein